MAVKLELYPVGPGLAQLLIGGSSAVPETVSLALQTNDGRYLGPDRQWQATAHWHPMFNAEPKPEGLAVMLDAQLVDTILGVGGVPLRVRVRLDEVEDAGVLRIRGVLIGSGAAAPPALAPTPQAVPPAPIQPASPDPARVAPPPVDEPDPVPTKQGGSRSPWVWAGAVVLLILFGWGAWLGAGWLGWHGGGPELAAGDPAAVDTAPAPEPTTVPDSGPDPSLQTLDASAETAPADAPRLSGVALARQFLSTGPRPEAIFERAEALEQAGDCPAAFALYSEAANVDPAMAARLARRYDPASHQAGPCIGASDIPYAIVYYTDAAESGEVQVQRRLGELMVNSEPSGPTREAGVRWLRTSAAAGDAEAARLLEGLGVTP